MALFPLGILSAAGAGGGAAASDYELIETQILGSAQSSFTFSSLGTYSSTYKHLQIRMSARFAFSDAERTAVLYVNGDTGSNYTHHGLYGTGSTVASFAATSATKMDLGSFPANNATANAFGPAVIDILDAYSTTKNKTIRTLSGTPTTPHITLRSGVWRNTASLTSITIYDPTSNLVTGSRFSLYGLKG